MAGVAEIHNIGSYLIPVPIFNASQGLAKSSDATGEIVGRVIDRLALGANAYSLKVCVPFGANTNTSVGVRVTCRMLHGTSTSTVTTAFGSTGIVKTFVTTGSATSTGISGAAFFDYDLRTANRFLQIGLTVDQISSSSGGLNYNAVAVFGGLDLRPAPAQSTSANLTPLNNL